MEEIIFSILICVVLADCKTLTSPTSVESKVDPVVVDDVAFFKLGTYSK